MLIEPSPNARETLPVDKRPSLQPYAQSTQDQDGANSDGLGRLFWTEHSDSVGTINGSLERKPDAAMAFLLSALAEW